MAWALDDRDATMVGCRLGRHLGGTVYGSRHLSVADADGNLVHEQDYGRKAGGSSATTCVAAHFGSTWTVELVQVR